jgi:hypothetical protein
MRRRPRRSSRQHENISRIGRKHPPTPPPSVLKATGSPWPGLFICSWKGLVRAYFALKPRRHAGALGCPWPLGEPASARRKSLRSQINPPLPQERNLIKKREVESRLGVVPPPRGDHLAERAFGSVRNIPSSGYQPMCGGSSVPVALLCA